MVSQTAYVAQEEAGSVTVCITVSGATLARPVVVTVSTEDITAIGMRHIVANGVCFQLVDFRRIWDEWEWQWIRKWEWQWIRKCEWQRIRKWEWFQEW